METEEKKDVNGEHIKKINADYQAERKQILSMTVQQRAERLGIFKLLYWAMVGKNEVPQETQTKAIELQKQFFTSNPKRIHPNPTIFKGIIDSNTIDKNAMSVFESCIREDMYWAR